MGRRKGRRVRSDEGGRSPGGGWALQHSPYTVEGEIEGLRKFADGAIAQRRDGRTRALRRFRNAYLVALAVPLVIGVVFTLVSKLF